MAKLNKITEEEKQLLFTDLCGRLPYSVLVQTKKFDFPVELRHLSLDSIPDIRPYLRRLKSMTVDEYDAMRYVYTFYGDSYIHTSEMYTCGKVADWLNKHHFDYRDLIDKGLAIEVKPGDEVDKLYKLDYEKDLSC